MSDPIAVILLDTETTGLPRRLRGGPVTQPRLVSISWIVASPGGESLSEASCIVRPEGFVIPPEAEKIHGISNQYALENGLRLEAVLKLVSSDCAEFPPRLVVAHNAAFDLPVIAAEFARLSLPNPLLPVPELCTMKTTTVLCCIPRRRGTGFKWPSLQELHIKLFLEPYEGVHQSIEDVRALQRCFDHLCHHGFYDAQCEVVQENLPHPVGPQPHAGYVFSCDNRTMAECLRKQLFADSAEWPLSVPPGSVAFLYNFQSGGIYGLWQVVKSGHRLDPSAWGGLFPCQCAVHLMQENHACIPRAEFPFLRRGRIPCRLPQDHLEEMLYAFQALLDP